MYMMTLGELSERMSKLSGWSLEENCIIKDLEFKDFKESMNFINKVAELSEKMNHHPDIIINFNRVRISLTTHEEHGLSNRDFDLAEEIDKIDQIPEEKTEQSENADNK